jgi:hypothetical protein
MMLQGVVLLVLAVGLHAAGCSRRVTVADRQQRVERVDTITIPRGVRANQALELRVVVGPLPERSRVVVRLHTGEVAGTITPFGPEARAAGGTYTIPLVGPAVTAERLILRLQLEDASGRPSRAPTAAEVRRIELVPIP